jgi:ABC-type antimicrobial peptide transport system permease subunit
MLAVAGTVLGLALSLGLGKVISAIIPAMGQFDIVALGLVSILLFAVAMLSSWLPAHRATRIDPLEALRED